MRSLLPKLRWSARSLRTIVVTGSLICAAASMGQQDPYFPPPGRVPFGKGQDPQEDQNLSRILQQAAKKRNIERQNRMIADALKIGQLARELNAEAEKSGGRDLPPAYAKKAEEIEKLAKSVKDRMKAE